MCHLPSSIVARVRFSLSIYLYPELPVPTQPFRCRFGIETDIKLSSKQTPNQARNGHQIEVETGVESSLKPMGPATLHFFSIFAAATSTAVGPPTHSHRATVAADQFEFEANVKSSLKRTSSGSHKIVVHSLTCPLSC